MQTQEMITNGVETITMRIFQYLFSNVKINSKRNYSFLEPPILNVDDFVMLSSLRACNLLSAILNQNVICRKLTRFSDQRLCDRHRPRTVRLAMPWFRL